MAEIALAIMLDALGWEIAKEYDFCKGLLPFSKPLETVLGYSSAAIPSLLTGKYPSEHGVWSMYKYNPQSSPFRCLRILPKAPDSLARRLKVLLRKYLNRRGTIKAYYDFYDIPLEYLGYFDLASKKDPCMAGGFKEESLFDRLRHSKIQFRIWDYRTPEAENFQELASSLDSSQTFFWLYSPVLDELMHRLGIHHETVRRKLRAYEEQVARLLERASKLGAKLYVYIFSDHGMTEVTKSIDLWKEIDGSGMKMGKDFMAFYDSTMARFWGGDKALRSIEDILGKNREGKVISPEELRELGCYFEDGCYGQVIFLADPGVVIVPSFMGREPMEAMHGYHPSDPSSKACFMTNDDSLPFPNSILDLKEFFWKRIAKLK